MVLSLAFGLFYRVGEHFRNGNWYMVWILFIVAMTYVGSVGKADLIPFGWGSVIVAVVSAAVFLPWGVASRLQHMVRPQMGEETAS
ncbi:MAG: hypothetical protein ACP5QO_11895 [Clostridia bacterium]